jgi:hypothetical protein
MYVHNSVMSTAAHATARRTFYLRRSVHVAIAGADHALCGMNLVGAIDTEFAASCADCLAHTFEQQPSIWATVEPVGDAVTFTGHPESTAGFDEQPELDAPEPEQSTAAMTAQSRESAARNTDHPLDVRTRYYNASARVLGASEEAAAQQQRVEQLRAQLAQAEQTLDDLQGVLLAARDEFQRAEDQFIG